MKNKGTCLSFYKVHSSDIVIRSPMEKEPSRLRYTPQKPTIFTHQIIFKEKNESDQSCKLKTGEFSMEKLTYEKFKVQKQMLENARLPAFNIKKLIDKSRRKRKELKKKDIDNSKSPSLGKSPLKNNNQLKQYWDNYLSHELSQLNLLQASSRHLSPLINKQKKSRSQLNKFQRLSDQGGQKTVKQVIISNNFIKTTYRKVKKHENKTYFKNELSLKQRINVLKKIDDEKDSINWMVPWEKGYDNEEQLFNQI